MSNFKNLNTVEKMMDGYNPYRQRQEETRGLISKWEPTGLLEGLDNEQKTILYQKLKIFQFWNTMKMLINLRGDSLLLKLKKKEN